MLSRVKLPAPDPSLTVWLDCDANNVVLPELIELTVFVPSTISLAVIDNELLFVSRVWFAAIEKIPVPLASLSALKLVVPLVVRLEERVIPSPAFTVKA